MTVHMNLDTSTSLTNVTETVVKKNVMKKILRPSAGVLTGLLLAASTAHAAPEITTNQPMTGSIVMVEQYSDGNVATITTTPNGITMQDGMPFAVTQITSVPRYVIRQGTTTVTTMPVTNQMTNQVTTVDVVSTPVNIVTQVLPVTTNNLPALTNQITTSQITTNPAISNQIISTASLDSLQLTPTFSTPSIVTAQTKIMKILKNGSGNEVAVPANHVAPGDVIEYHTTYTNNSAQPVNDLNAMVSLPNGIKLLSLNSTLPTLVTTGGDSYQTIQQVGNNVVIQENYAGLKWNFVNFDSNAAQTVVIRAKVQ